MWARRKPNRSITAILILICLLIGFSACNPATDPAGGTEIDPAGGTEIDPAGGTETNPAGGTETNPAGGTETNPAGGTVVLFINVGKADAALLMLGGRNYLIDTGTKEAYPKLRAALVEYGVSRLDGVFLTHTHSDHVGGLKQLAEGYEIAMLYFAELSLPNKEGEHKLVNRAQKLGLPFTLLHAGDILQPGAGEMAVLGPQTLDTEDDNDNSLVLLLSLGGARLLFTGDMQFAEEATLLAAGLDVRCDLLKVGNHGNPDATSEAFAAEAAPFAAVISTDTEEDRDSAAPRVVAALKDAAVYLTQDCKLGVLAEIGADGSLMIEQK